MQDKVIRVFTRSAGALLLCMAAALFLTNLTNRLPDIVPPRDPIFVISIPRLFWIIGAIALAMALACLFDEKARRPVLWLAWLATNFLAYRLVLLASGCRSLSGYLWDFSKAFGLSAGTADLLAHATLAYLLVGSYSLIAVSWAQKLRRAPVKQESLLGGAEGSIKNACAYCGGKVQFSAGWLGRKIDCPHCKAAITLREPPSALA